MVEILTKNCGRLKTECDSEAQAIRFAKLHEPTYKALIYKKEENNVKEK